MAGICCRPEKRYLLDSRTGCLCKQVPTSIQESCLRGSIRRKGWIPHNGCRQGASVEMTTLTVFDDPGATGDTSPTRSPLCVMAFPDRESFATTVT